MNDMPLENNELDFDNNLLLQLYFHLILEAINLYITTTNLPELEKKTMSIGDGEENSRFQRGYFRRRRGRFEYFGRGGRNEIKIKVNIKFHEINWEVEMKTGNFTYEDVMKKVYDENRRKIK